MGIYRQLTRKRVVRVVVDAGVRTCDHIPNQTSERGPEFTGDFDAPVAQNFFVIGANNSMFAVLCFTVYVNAHRIKVPRVRTSNLDLTCW